ncbi:hypothetical protein [Clostridium intestinale]|uniref:Phage protein n=1 Tax=Clostridium intestinale URNW TaxID=1294142 RepID=U2Q4T2_9CLOT|nr:hypothetical protein [Clostridium intestinale]ERK31114.1 hypothetical protein CINTURNW_1702 [Clostridium intestinale URNW]
MIDKDSKFQPSKEEAYKEAKSYWDGLTESREKTLETISASISASVKSSIFSVTHVIKKCDSEYVKQKLEDVGYEVSFGAKDDDTEFIIVSFEK